MKVYISKEKFNAIGEYSEKSFIVKAGSTINPSFAPYIKTVSTVKYYRDNREFVDDKWTVIQDCIFVSPSTAAQFVMGQSRDGYDAWKVEGGKSLGKYLAASGLRERIRRKKDN